MSETIESLRAERDAAHEATLKALLAAKSSDASLERVLQKNEELRAERDALRAANERMEAALTSLATADLKQIGPWSMREVAREALSTHPVEKARTK